MKKKKEWVMTRCGKGWCIMEAGLLGATAASVVTGHPEIASPLFYSQLAVLPSSMLIQSHKLKEKKKLKKVV